MKYEENEIVLVLLFYKVVLPQQPLPRAVTCVRSGIKGELEQRGAGDDDKFIQSATVSVVSGNVLQCFGHFAVFNVSPPPPRHRLLLLLLGKRTTRQPVRFKSVLFLL